MKLEEYLKRGNVISSSGYEKGSSKHYFKLEFIWTSPDKVVFNISKIIYFGNDLTQYKEPSSLYNVQSVFDIMKLYMPVDMVSALNDSDDIVYDISEKIIKMVKPKDSYIEEFDVGNDVTVRISV